MLLFGWKTKFYESYGWDLRFDTLPQVEDFTGEIVYEIVDMTESKDRNWFYTSNAYYLVVEKRKKKKATAKSANTIAIVHPILKDFFPTEEPERFRMPYHFKIGKLDRHGERGAVPRDVCRSQGIGVCPRRFIASEAIHQLGARDHGHPLPILLDLHRKLSY